jgi:hypothetical protein
MKRSRLEQRRNEVQNAKRHFHLATSPEKTSRSLADRVEHAAQRAGDMVRRHPGVALGVAGALAATLTVCVGPTRLIRFGRRTAAFTAPFAIAAARDVVASRAADVRARRTLPTGSD